MIVALFRDQRVIAFGIFIASLLLFTVGLAQQEIIGFESRFYLFALEMWRHGLSWFPTTYGRPYPDYPVIPTLFIYGLAKWVGCLNKWVAVFPSAVAAALTLSVTYLIGALHDRRWGLLAVFFMLLTNTFVMEARTISPDQFVVFATTLSFYLVYSATLFDKKGRLFFIPVLLFFGFACRGPIGLVVPAGVICLFYLVDKQYRQFLLIGIVSVILLCVSCGILFGIAHHLGGMAFMNEVWHTEVSGRLQDAYLPWYFYFSESLGSYAITYPLAFFVLCGVMLQRHEMNLHDLKLFCKLTVWVLVILLGLSIPAGKKIRYILAMTPALALISAALFVLPVHHRYSYCLQRIVRSVLFLLPTLCLLLMVFSQQWVLQHHARVDVFVVWQHVDPQTPMMIIVLSVLQGLQYMLRKFDVCIVGVAALVFCAMYIVFIEPINIFLNQSRDFVLAVESVRIAEKARLVFYQENPDGTPIKYMANMPVAVQPVFISTSNALVDFHTPAVFIADPEHFAALPKTVLQSVKILNTGRVGHNKLVAFEKMD